MDQLLVDTAVRRLKAKNAKTVTLLKHYFADLSRLLGASMSSLASFSPAKVEPLALRASYAPVYKWMAVQLSDIYGFSVDAELLSGLSANIDMVEGVIEVKVLLTYNRKSYKFEITFNDETAPYSKRWPELLAQQGVTDIKFAQLMQLV